ncbi:Cold shock domain-containing protein E1 [Nymphon striatum]|nr:Cold shock domain-containing protein E1 [Nymphon striatum]
MVRRGEMARAILEGGVKGSRGRGRPMGNWLGNLKEWSGQAASVLTRRAEDRVLWRNSVRAWCFEPPIQDTAILAYQTVDPSFSPSQFSSVSVREFGMIEKLMPTYGFIQCSDRQDRLFFHFSQFHGSVEVLKVGDSVQFEKTYDRRTGKPIASNVYKANKDISRCTELVKCVTGTITTEIKDFEDDSYQGRISYENRGECFFLPYTKNDILDKDTPLNSGDLVTFQIASNDVTGAPVATNIKTFQLEGPNVYEGVICTLKDTFGFIERADIVKEIFFHVSECKNVNDLNLGDDVQFSIQTRNNKEVACNVERLPEGSVVFEDILPEIYQGQISKTIERQLPKVTIDSFTGNIKYSVDNVDKEITFGDRDVECDHTLMENDWIQFNVAVDRRDSLHRATRIHFLNAETFSSSKEKREKGIIFTLKEGFGFIKCANREHPRLFFHFSEIIDKNNEIHAQDEVEFHVSQDSGSSNRYNAIRIFRLPRGSVSFDYHNNRNSMLHGFVELESTTSSLKDNSSPTPEGIYFQSCESGVIKYCYNGTTEHVKYLLKDCVDPKNLPKVNNKVEFNLNDNDNGLSRAINIKVLSKIQANGKNSQICFQGFIAALRENFGFIETSEHTREIFFHYSVFEGDSNRLELGQEVEYELAQKCVGNASGKMSADVVRKIPCGSIPVEKAYGDALTGVIQRPIRCFNPEQEEYAGLIQVKSEENGNSPIYSFGITSLIDKKVFVQTGDVVEFQLGKVDNEEVNFAVNIKAIRDRYQANVEALKGQYGFLSHEVDGKKLFFHKSEVKDINSNLKPGDLVEFVIIKNQKKGRYSACDVKLLCSGSPPEGAPRPEHLTRLRNLSLSQDETTPRLVTIRQPTGPETNNNFKSHPMLPEIDED